MRVFPTVGLLALVLAAAPAEAKESEATAKVKSSLAEVERARKVREWDKAARAVADAALGAQRQNALDLEMLAAAALQELLDAMGPEKPAGGGTTADVGPREVLAIVMKALAPARHGAYLSAHALATELLLRAIEQGDAAHLPAAQAVLVAFAASPKCGKAGPALKALAEAVQACRATDATGARKAFELALPLVKQGRWLRATLAAQLEWMALQVAEGDVAAASATLQEAVGYLAPKQDGGIARAWVTAARARLATAPEEVRGALDRAVEPYVGAGSAGAAGGRGGDGGSAGANVSPLGRAWPKLPAEKPFATVKRAETGYDVRFSFDKKFAALHPVEAGQTTWDEDGLTLVFADGAVALRMLDMEGTAGQPGGRSDPSPAWGWYWLAPGETYGVTKSGTVHVN
jgi:hypothetical protein